VTALAVAPSADCLSAAMPDVASARALLPQVQALLRAHGLALRPPPAEPVGCCGRGCSGCVWLGWLDAAQWWRDDARALLQAPAPTSPP